MNADSVTSKVIVEIKHFEYIKTFYYYCCVFRYQFSPCLKLFMMRKSFVPSRTHTIVLTQEKHYVLQRCRRSYSEIFYKIQDLASLSLRIYVQGFY